MRKALVLPSLCFAFLAGSFVGSSIGAQSAFQSLQNMMGPFGSLLHASDVFSIIVPPAMKASLLAVVVVTLIYATTRGGRFLFSSASRASGHAETSDRG